MRNNRLLPYETIVQAASGEPEAVGTVLQYYRRRIQCAARVNGRVDQDTEDYITQTLLTAIFKFRFGRFFTSASIFSIRLMASSTCSLASAILLCTI